MGYAKVDSDSVRVYAHRVDDVPTCRRVPFLRRMGRPIFLRPDALRVLWIWRRMCRRVRNRHVLIMGTLRIVQPVGANAYRTNSAGSDAARSNYAGGHDTATKRGSGRDNSACHRAE